MVRARMTVVPAAAPRQIAASRFIRNAGSPNGCSTIDATHARITQVGKPVGWAVPSSGPTAWYSAVSQ